MLSVKSSSTVHLPLRLSWPWCAASTMPYLRRQPAPLNTRNVASGRCSWQCTVTCNVCLLMLAGGSHACELKSRPAAAYRINISVDSSNISKWAQGKRVFTGKRTRIWLYYHVHKPPCIQRRGAVSLADVHPCGCACWMLLLRQSPPPPAACPKALASANRPPHAKDCERGAASPLAGMARALQPNGNGYNQQS